MDNAAHNAPSAEGDLLATALHDLEVARGAAIECRFPDFAESAERLEACIHGGKEEILDTMRRRPEMVRELREQLNELAAVLRHPAAVSEALRQIRASDEPTYGPSGLTPSGETHSVRREA